MRDDEFGEGDSEKTTPLPLPLSSPSTLPPSSSSSSSSSWSLSPSLSSSLAVNSKKPQQQYPFALDTPYKMPKGRKFIARKFIKIEIMIKDKRGNYTQTNWKNAAIKHEIKCLNQFEWQHAHNESVFIYVVNVKRCFRLLLLASSNKQMWYSNGRQQPTNQTYKRTNEQKRSRHTQKNMKIKQQTTKHGIL